MSICEHGFSDAKWKGGKYGLGQYLSTFHDEEITEVSLLKSMGRSREALPLYRATLAAQREKLGAGDAEVLKTTVNLAALLDGMTGRSSSLSPASNGVDVAAAAVP